MNITVFLGAPGSGKGTQAKRLAHEYHFQHLSTGDMLRSAIQKGTDVGKRAKEFVDRGELVPDEIMIEIIGQALSVFSNDAKIILDGFPRTLRQAEALDLNSNTHIKSAINFVLPEETLISRLTGRRICDKCGEPYHILFMPTKKEGQCNKCGGKLIQRTDDAESVVRRRLQVFNQQTQPVIEYYVRANKLHELNGDQSVDQLKNALIHILL